MNDIAEQLASILLTERVTAPHETVQALQHILSDWSPQERFRSLALALHEQQNQREVRSFPEELHEEMARVARRISARESIDMLAELILSRPVDFIRLAEKLERGGVRLDSPEKLNITTN